MVDFESIFAIVAKEAAIDPSRLTPDATLEELSITSLDVLNILFAIEDEYKMEFDPSEFEEVRTLQKFAAVITAKANLASQAAQNG